MGCNALVKPWFSRGTARLSCISLLYLASFILQFLCLQRILLSGRTIISFITLQCRVFNSMCFQKHTNVQREGLSICLDLSSWVNYVRLCVKTIVVNSPNKISLSRVYIK